MNHVTMMSGAVCALLGVAPLAQAIAIPQIHRAVRDGDAGRVETMIAENPAIVGTADHSGRTALHLAAGAGHLPLIELLVAHGSDVNAVDNAKESPLHAASRTPHARGIDCLLRNGARIDAANKRGETALHLAIQARGQSKGAHESRKQVVTLLVGHGAAVNAEDGRKMRPLHVAAATRRIAMVRVLIEAKAEVGARDVQGRTATHWAALAGEPAILKQLHEAGADINAVDVRRETPLHCAARRGRTEATSFLLSHGAEVNARGADGQTPLLIAAQAPGHQEADDALAAVAELLCSAGADVHLATHAGATPLQEAQRRERPQLVDTLRRHGATQ